MNREIENRIQKANNVSYQLAPLLERSDIPMETKSKIINSIFLPTLTHQCQTSTMTKPLERKITTCEMRCLRKVVNKTRRDMIPNTKIREMVGTKSIHHYIQQQRIKWSEDQMVWTPHKTANPTPSSTCIWHKIQWLQNKRTPRKTWINRVKETLSLYNIPPAHAFRCAADKRLFLPATPQVV